MSLQSGVQWENMLATSTVEATPPTDSYVVVGALDNFGSRTKGRSKLREILVSAKNLGPNPQFCDITLVNAPPTLGPETFHEVLGVEVEGEPPTGFINIIPGALAFIRYTDGGAIFNPFAGETFWNSPSPADTEWNSSIVDPVHNGFADLSDLNQRTFTTMYDAVDQQFGNKLVGLEMIMRHIPTGRQYAIVFTNWEKGSDGGGPGPYGGFAFTMQEIMADPACRLNFSDGSFLDSANGINTDRSLMPGVAFISPTGNNNTATVGDQNLPFLSISVATSQADIFIFLPGIYSASTWSMQDGKTYIAMAGAEFTGGTISAVSANTTAKFLGSAIFREGHRGFRVSGIGSNIQIEFDKMVGNISFLEATVDCEVNVTCNSILNTGGSGFAGGGTIRDGANVNVSVRNFWHCNHRLIFFRANTKPYEGTFEVTCPDMRIIEGGPYGNLVKSVFDMDSCAGAEFIFNGNMTNANSVIGAGIVSGVLGITNHFVPSKFTINGDMDGGAGNTCIWTSYRARTDEFIINGDITAENNFPLYLRPSGGNFTGIMNHLVLNGSKITGQNWPVSIEDGFEIYFKDCSFYNGEISAGTTPNVLYSAGEGDPSNLYFYNCIAEADGSAIGGEFITGGAAIGILGCSNVVSNDPLGVGAVDSFAGYSVIAGIKVPKF
jgi:hypothetical protein